MGTQTLKSNDLDRSDRFSIGNARLSALALPWNSALAFSGRASKL